MGDTAKSASDGQPIDYIGGLVRIFVDEIQGDHVRTGCPVQRGAFRQFHGGAFGIFTVHDDLPEADRIGLFSHQRFSAWIRFSSDAELTQGDFGQECGIGIKLFGVPGPKLQDAEATTHDFVFQNIPRFFVDDAKEMYEDSKDDAAFLATHPLSAKILDDMTAPVGSVLSIPYWSCVPSRFGADRYVKYKLVPDGVSDRPPKAQPIPGYLSADLRQRLWEDGARFTFLVQFQRDAERMPLDRATVQWDEELSPPRPFATLELPRQDIAARGNAAYLESLAFTPWNALPEHEPVGTIQEARRAVYAASAKARHLANGVVDEEPRHPRDCPVRPTK